MVIGVVIGQIPGNTTWLYGTVVLIEFQNV
jgi:hypothetical protein